MQQISYLWVIFEIHACHPLSGVLSDACGCDDLHIFLEFVKPKFKRRATIEKAVVKSRHFIDLPYWSILLILSHFYIKLLDMQ